MSDMRYSPPQEIRSAVWLMLNVISLGVIQLRERLGLTLSNLSRFLAQAEPALRRCLYLCAAELGALPAPVHVSTGSSPPRSRPAKPHIARASQPAFRLFETRAQHPDAKPPRPTFKTGPRIRFLDADDVPDIHEYDKLPSDILPAKRLVRRLMALDYAMDHRDLYIEKIRRSLGEARQLIAKTGKRLFRHGPLTRLQCETAQLIEAETHAVQPHFNSS
ncbi:hypothetical protein L53_09995 [Hyphomonas sp. L-53-1-40]|uniref:hypothetical protein n=1 Tax=Hyphomonas sp. L-53-1-40 TaxID=1207058 RepID=UPI000458E0D1|nr:hypothetical protein [Hyphomonas sp. L-53-1-40]KCZ62898.1 hypothetical protein L53_09995 [Hyphomonas sp. L-53-1-40]